MENFRSEAFPFAEHELGKREALPSAIADSWTFPLQHELGSGSPDFRSTYRANDSDRKFFISPSYCTILKTKCEYSGTLFIISRKYFFGFSRSALTPRYTILDSMFPLVMQSRKAGFPFAARARKREPCLQRYISRMTRTENFLSQFFFKIFLETTFIHVLWYAVHY